MTIINTKPAISEAIIQKVASLGLSMEVKQEINRPHLQGMRRFVGLEKYYPLASCDIALTPADWKKSIDSTVKNFFARSGYPMMGVSWWPVYAKKEHGTFFTTSIERIGPDSINPVDCHLIGFVFMESLMMLSNYPDDTDFEVMEEAEGKHLEAELNAIAHWKDSDLYLISLKEGERTLGQDYVMRWTGPSVDDVVSELIAHTNENS